MRGLCLLLFLLVLCLLFPCLLVLLVRGRDLYPCRAHDGNPGRDNTPYPYPSPDPSHSASDADLHSRLENPNSVVHASKKDTDNPYPYPVLVRTTRSCSVSSTNIYQYISG